MWAYCQSSGKLYDPDGKEVGAGYAGLGIDRNNPRSQHLGNSGPLPRGIYAIGAPEDKDTTGPYSLTLTPIGSQPMFGRGGFFIHGDSSEHPGQASHGCPVFYRGLREKMWDSEDHLFLVGY